MLFLAAQMFWVLNNIINSRKKIREIKSHNYFKPFYSSTVIGFPRQLNFSFVHELDSNEKE